MSGKRKRKPIDPETRARWAETRRWFAAWLENLEEGIEQAEAELEPRLVGDRDVVDDAARLFGEDRALALAGEGGVDDREHARVRPAVLRGVELIDEVEGDPIAGRPQCQVRDDDGDEPETANEEFCPAGHRRQLYPAALDCGTRLALGLAAFDRLTLVDRLLAFRERDLELGASLRVEEELQRHDRQALLGRLAEELVQLGAPEQELPRAQRVVRRRAAVAVLADVRVQQERLAAVQLAIAVAQVGAPLANRFDFRPQQRDPGLECLEHMEVVPGLAVVRDDLIGLAHVSWRACRPQRPAYACRCPTAKSGYVASRSLITLGDPSGHSMANAGSSQRTPS